MPRSQKGFEQEELFIVAQQTGQVAPREFATHSVVEGALPLEPFSLERDLHLQNVITHLAARNQAEGFLSYDAPAEYYGDRAAEMRQNMADKLTRETHQAKVEFAKATGHYALLDAGYPKEEVQAATQNLFSDFLRAYGGAHNYVKAQEYRRSLAARVEARLAGQTPVQVKPVATVEQKQELPKIPFFERLEVVQKDPRAGFLPATRQEVNHVFAWLDTSDIGQQVLEAHDHRQGPRGGNGSWRDARRTVESIIYTVDDYLLNAISSHELLTDLQQQLAAIPNPRITLGDEFEEAHPAFAVLARFKDQQEYARTGKVRGLKPQPMRTHTNRWTREGDGPHKRTEDQYTREDPRPAFKKRIESLPASLTIQEARKLVNEALDNEEKRASFMMKQVLAIRKVLATRRLFAHEVEIVDTTLTERRRVS